MPSSSKNKSGGGKPASFRPLDQQELRFDNVEHLMHVHGRYHELSDVQKEQMIILEKKYLKMNEFPNDRFHPFFYHVYSQTLPLEHHYRVVPKGKLQICIIVSRQCFIQVWHHLISIKFSLV